MIFSTGISLITYFSIYITPLICRFLSFRSEKVICMSLNKSVVKEPSLSNTAPSSKILMLCSLYIQERWFVAFFFIRWLKFLL